MDGTILGQGSFTATYPANPHAGNASISSGSPVTIAIPSNADWVKVIDYTGYGRNGATATVYLNGSIAVASSTAITWYWQRGMAAGTALVEYKTPAANTMTTDIITAGGFTLYDPSGQSVGQGAQPFLSNPVATTLLTNATQPVATTASTANVAVGGIVRMSQTAQTDVNGIDMVVGAVTATTITLLTGTNALANVPGIAGGPGFYTIVNYTPLFYPTRLYVTNIAVVAGLSQVSTSIAHNYVAGQTVRFNIPASSGMIQLNPTAQNNYQYSTITSVVDAYNFTIDTNITAFTAFTWPTAAQMPGSFPTVAPLGENTASALLSTQPQTPPNPPIYGANNGILSDSTVNTGYLGMILGAGGLSTLLGGGAVNILGPSGSVAYTAGDVPTGDKMYWVAGKSTYGGL